MTEEEKATRLKKLFNFNFIDHIRRQPQALIPMYIVCGLSIIIGGITMYNKMNGPDVILKHQNDGTNPDFKQLHEGVILPDKNDDKKWFEKKKKL